MSTSAGTTDLIGKNRYTFKMNYNDYMLANTRGRAGARRISARSGTPSPRTTPGATICSSTSPMR